MNDRELVAGGEGFQIFTAESNGRFFLIIDESTTIALLSEEDAEGLEPEHVLDFLTEEARATHLTSILSRFVDRSER